MEFNSSSKKGSPQKFLRRSSQEHSDIFEKSLNENRRVDTATDTEDARSISRAVLRKIEIVRDKQKRLKIIKTISKLKSPWVPAVLLETLHDPSEEIKDFVVKELAQRKELPLDCFYQKLCKTPWFIKSAVLRILSLRKKEDAVKHIQLVLNDANVDVRRSAALALGEIGGKEAKICLLQLAKDKSCYVRMAAEEALRKMIDLKFT
ncbi:MAG: HEAT repeat domain-containing protein [Candidatus Aminicenantales bacterium]